MHTCYQTFLDVASGVPRAQQTILSDLGWYFGPVDAGRMPAKPPRKGSRTSPRCAGRCNSST